MSVSERGLKLNDSVLNGHIMCGWFECVIWNSVCLSRRSPVMKTISTAWYEILKPNSIQMQLLSVSERNISRCIHLYTIAESMPCLKEFDTSLTWGFELLSNRNHIGQKLVEFWNRLYSLTIYMKTSMVLCFHQFLETSLLRNLSELTIKSCVSAFIHIIIFFFFFLRCKWRQNGSK